MQFRIAIFVILCFLTTPSWAFCFSLRVNDGVYTDAPKNPTNCRDANGNKQGLWGVIKPDGTVIAAGTYLNDKEHGAWEFMSPDGETITTFLYTNGILQN